MSNDNVRIGEYANGEVYEETRDGNIIYYSDSTGLKAEKTIDDEQVVMYKDNKDNYLAMSYMDGRIMRRDNNKGKREIFLYDGENTYILISERKFVSFIKNGLSINLNDYDEVKKLYDEIKGIVVHEPGIFGKSRYKINTSSNVEFYFDMINEGLMLDTEVSMALGVSYSQLYQMKRESGKNVINATFRRRTLSSDIYEKMKNGSIARGEAAKIVGVSHSVLVAMIREYENSNNIKNTIIKRYNLKKEIYIDFYNRNIMIDTLEKIIKEFDIVKEKKAIKKRREAKEESAKMKEINTREMKGEETMEKEKVVTKEPTNDIPNNGGTVEIDSTTAAEETNIDEKSLSITLRHLLPLYSNRLEVSFEKNGEWVYVMELQYASQMYEMISLGILAESILDKKVSRLEIKNAEENNNILFIVVEV